MFCKKKQKYMEHPVFSKKTEAHGTSYVLQKKQAHGTSQCNKKQKHIEHPVWTKAHGTSHVLQKTKSMWNILCSAKKTKVCGTSCVQQKNKSIWNILYKQKHMEHPMCNKKKSTWNILYKQKYMEHPMFCKKTKACGTSQPKASLMLARSWPEAVCDQYTAWTSCELDADQAHQPVGMFQPDPVCVRPQIAFPKAMHS